MAKDDAAGLRAPHGLIGQSMPVNLRQGHPAAVSPAVMAADRGLSDVSSHRPWGLRGPLAHKARRSRCRAWSIWRVGSQPFPADCSSKENARYGAWRTRNQGLSESPSSVTAYAYATMTPTTAAAISNVSSMKNLAKTLPPEKQRRENLAVTTVTLRAAVTGPIVSAHQAERLCEIELVHHFACNFRNDVRHAASRSRREGDAPIWTHAVALRDFCNMHVQRKGLHGGQSRPDDSR